MRYLSLCFVLLIASHLQAQSGYSAWTPLGRELMQLDAPEQQKFFGEGHAGKLEINPVILPEGANVVGNNVHFGWPVATLGQDGSLNVVYFRMNAHWDNEPDANASPAMFIRSTDGGTTWSNPLDLRVRRVDSRPTLVNFGNSIMTASDGTIHLLSPAGYFRSPNNGRHWDHVPGAFTADQLSGPRGNIGPKLVEHPTIGIIALGHQGTPFPSDTIWMRYSQDNGNTWLETSQQFTIGADPVEPTGLWHDGALIVLARSHGSYEPQTRTWRYVQMVARDGELLTPQFTNIRTSDVQDLKPEGGWPYPSLAGSGPWSQDTTALIFNPVTNRIEAVVTNRTGGGPDELDDHDHATLNLWSIDPEQLLNGSAEWQFEATLLKRYGTTITKGLEDEASYFDGMHPGGSIVDEENGVQHLFIYSGYTKGGSGIYQITRTLDTPALVEYLSGVPEPATIGTLGTAFGVLALIRNSGRAH